MASIGELVVSLTADTGQFSKQISTVQDSFGNFGKTVTTIGAAVSSIGVPFALMAKSAIDNADALSKTAQKVGVTTEALSRLQYAASLSDVDVNALQGSLTKLSVKVNDAAEGGKKSAEVFSSIGVSIRDSSGSIKGADTLLTELSARFAALPDGVEKTALAVQLFGKAGAEMIPFLNSGPEGLRKLFEESDRFGKTISGATGKAAEDFNDAITRLSAAITGLANAFISTGLLDKLTGLIIWASDLISAFAQANPYLVEAVAIIGGLAAVIGPALVAAGALAAAIGALSTPVLAVFGGAGVLAAAIAAILSFMKSNEDAAAYVTDVWNSLKSYLSGILDALLGVFSAAADAIKAVWDAWGPQVTAIFKALFDLLGPLVSNAFKLLGTTIKNALDIIKGLLQVFTGIVSGDWNKFADGIKTIWAALWNQIKSIIMAPLNAVKDSVGNFTTTVTSYFRDMYQKVVGNSFVPDMVGGIKIEFGKLGSIMVDPTQKATSSVQASFKTMFDQVQKFATDWKSALKDTAFSIVDSLGGIGGAIDTIINKDWDKILGGLKSIIGLGGGSSGGGIGGIFGGGGASTAGGIAGGAGSIASSAIGGAIAGGISAAGSLIGSMRLEGTMNAVEYNTRASMIHLGVMIDQLFWPNLPHIPAIRDILQEQVNQLDAIFNAIVGSPSMMPAAVAAGSSPINVTVNFSVEAPIRVVQKIDRRIVRDDIMPEWIDAFESGQNSVRAKIVEGVKNSLEGVVSTRVRGQ